MAKTGTWPVDLAADPTLEESFALLRHKWDEVPAGPVRVHSTELLKLPDAELLRRWKQYRIGAATGGRFRSRGWRQLLYQDVFRSKRVVDFGCGLGFDSVHFVEHGARVTFVDLVEANVEVMRRVCRLKRLDHCDFLYMQDLTSLAQMDEDYDAIYCCGSLINAPLPVVRLEAQELLRHLNIGGRWLELGYPKIRWERDGCRPFKSWGETTDGGAPWTEWHDLEKVLAYLAPATFDVVLYFEFHDGDFNWFDLVRRS